METENRIEEALKIIDFENFNKFFIENIDTRLDSGKTTEDEIGDIFETYAMANVEGIIGHEEEREKYISKAAENINYLNEAAGKLSYTGFLKEGNADEDIESKEKKVRALHTIIRYYKEILDALEK